MKKWLKRMANPYDYKIPLRSKYEDIEVVTPESFKRNYYMGIVKIEK